MTRRKFIYSFFASASLVYPCFWEPRWLDLTHRRVKLPRGGIRQPVRILHLADLHASMPVPLSMIQHAITVGLAQKPDIVCLTGDFITYRHDFDAGAYAQALRRLSAAAPTFAVLENHDGGSWTARHLGNP